MKVTRDVIVDLWPLYSSGEASPDTRALVEAFLDGDPAFANELRREVPLSEGVVMMGNEADQEMKTFLKAKRRVLGYPMLLMFAMMFTCMAFGRIVADTSWDVSPSGFIATAVIALGFWVAFFWSLWKIRSRILIAPAATDRRPGNSK